MDQAFYDANRDRCCTTTYAVPYDQFCSGGRPAIGIQDIACYIGTPYSTNPSTTQSCACTRGTQYKSITDACGSISPSFDSPCLTNPNPNPPAAPVSFAACGNDFSVCSPMPAANMADFPNQPASNECRDAAARNGQFTRVCRDIDTLQTLVPATASVLCQGPGVFLGLNPGVGCTLLASRQQEVNDTTPCGSGRICRDGACRQVDASQCSFLRDFLGIRAAFEYPSDAAPSFAANQAVPFAAVASDRIASYQWDFGDGSPSASGRETRHTYASPGTYTITLTVFDRYECTTIARKAVTITVAAGPSPTPPTPPPQGGAVRILQPEEGLIYNAIDVPLHVAVEPQMECAYQLNQDSFARIVENPGRITAREGANRITIRCGEQQVQRQFQVVLQHQDVRPRGIVDDLRQEAEEVIPTPEDIDQLIASVSSQGNVVVTKIGEAEGGMTKLTLRVRNEKLLPISDVKLRVTFPKDILPDVRGLQGSGFTIIKADPVIEYNLGNLTPAMQREAVVRLNAPLDKAALDRITTDVRHATDPDAVEAIKRRQALMGQFSDIKRTVDKFTKDGVTFSTVTTSIKPKKGLKNVSYYQEIPKCLAQHIDELEFKNKDLLKVVNPDPLIMWRFDDIQSDVDLSFNVRGVIDEDCIRQIKDLALAEALGLDLKEDKTPKLLLTLLVLPIIAIIFLYFSRFKGRLQKEEIAIERSPEQLAREAKETAAREENKTKDELNRQIRKAEQEMKRHLR